MIAVRSVFGRLSPFIPTSNGVRLKHTPIGKRALGAGEP